MGITAASGYPQYSGNLITPIFRNFDTWKAGFLKSAGIELARTIDPVLLTEMYTSAAATNSGATAGVQSANINLGTAGAPLVITSANIVSTLSLVHQVLDEACAPKEGRFITLPPAGMTALRNSDLQKAYLTALNWSPLINGKVPETVMGFTILESMYIPRVIDGTVNKLSYHLVAGVKMATAFAATIEDSRVITDKDDWANYYQGLSVFGFKTLYEDGLVHIYATFDAS